MDRETIGLTTFRKLRYSLLEYKDEYDLDHRDFAVFDVVIGDYKNYVDAYGPEFCRHLVQETGARMAAGGLNPHDTAQVDEDMLMSLCGFEKRRELREIENSVRESLDRINEIDRIPCRPDYRIRVKAYSEMSYMERLMLMSHHRARGRDNFSIEEMQLCMHEFRKFFQVVRLVNPSEMREVYFDADGRVREEDRNCYEVWRRSGRCENCTTARACTQNDSFIKFEFIDNQIYFVISQAVSVEGKRFVLELVRDASSSISESMLGNLFMNEEFVARMQQANGSQYRDEVTGLRNRKYYEECISGLNAVAAAVLEADSLQDVKKLCGDEAADRAMHRFGQTVQQNIPTNAELIRYSENRLLLVMDYISYNTVFDLLAGLQAKLREEGEKYRKELFGVDVGEGDTLNLRSTIGGVYGYGIVSDLTGSALDAIENMCSSDEKLVVKDETHEEA